MSSYTATPNVRPTHDANMLGLDYRAEAAKLTWKQPIWDTHVHLRSLEAARLHLQVADVFGVQRVWTMSQLELVDAIRDEFGDRIQFIAVPNYFTDDWAYAMTTDWLRRIEGFAEKGVKICKFWGAPRGLDLHESMRLDAPLRLESMRLARSAGMMFMFHVADPDIWFDTVYQDAGRYGTKAEQYRRFDRVMQEFSDVPSIVAHMGGDPEHLDHVQALLDRYPNVHLDTAAAKWMTRELSKTPQQLREFCRRNAGRVLFGTDIVADPETMSFDLLASRYWALRAMLETDYDGPNPIVDPDLARQNPALPENATAQLRGAAIDQPALAMLYRGAAEKLLSHTLHKS